MSPAATLRVLVWTADRASLGTPRGRTIRDGLHRVDADLICLTEASADLLPPGHVVTSSPFPYGPAKTAVRKVVLWSRSPWTEADDVGHPDLPPGRFVHARTQTCLGPVSIAGLCIPYSGAGMRERGRARWKEHEDYLDALGRFLPEAGGGPELLVGDFNQHLPRQTQPLRVHQKLAGLLGRGYTVATEAPLPPAPGAADDTPDRSLEHLAHGPRWRCEARATLSRKTAAGMNMSDRNGLVLTLARA
ncbi:endonuclease/exonuclease/phosphatase family protein [Ancylobacter lacus]|uniref:endonuclease/exonuclease/phosphatase family protein n=1 Tax=Ancylobacter lacus TaxID=2579970 RepID=UPI001BCFC4AB|nr:endonuclease/exonuclease/phosphatase family protein [Ancylobacter lacus]MBS7540603.1 endonuclease/exonuclease/phosphatase family protein [Ancylobacter lacus]